MTEETLPWVMGFLAVLIAFMAVVYDAGYKRGSTGKLRSSCEVEHPGQLKAGWYRAP